jgi:hypothetical protein
LLICQRCRAEVESAQAAVDAGWGAVSLGSDTTVAACPACKALFQRVAVAFFDGCTFNFKTPATPEPATVVN